MPKFSVIIPTYNRASVVVGAIESVLAQTYHDLELIVVDDGSTDNTREVVQRYGHCIRYVGQPNMGVAGARNTGINLSTGTWLAFLDSDDEWNSDYLATQAKFLDANTDIDIQTTYCNLIGHGGSEHTYFELNRSATLLIGSDYARVEKPFKFLVEHTPWQVGSTVCRRSAAIRAGLFDPSLRLSEDLEFMARMCLQGPMALIRKPLVRVIRRPGAIDFISSVSTKDPVASRTANDIVYRALRQLHGLTFEQRKSVERMMSRNRRALGHLLANANDMNGAKHWYVQSLQSHVTSESIVSYAAAHLPQSIRRLVYRLKDEIQGRVQEPTIEDALLTARPTKFGPDEGASPR